MAEKQKKSVLVVGGGAVGAIAALNLEIGGLATVTVVLRSNFKAVNEGGYFIESCDHGILKGWKPSFVRNEVPDISAEKLNPYDYIILTTKNIPDIPPSISSLISPALPPNNTHTTLVLIQNGLNIERPFLKSHPSTAVLSGVSLIGSAETAPSIIVQDDKDRLLIGPFSNPSLDPSTSSAKAQEFVEMYGRGGKTECVYSENVLRDRWRKLVYNACLNPICAITGLDTGRIRLADQGIEGIVRPAMREIVEAAKARGVELEEGVVGTMIEIDPLDIYLSPSMLADVRKGNFIEHENLLGEPLREGLAAGVSMPTLTVIYNICRTIQWRTREARGFVEIPPKRKAAE
ncbi:ketopantoate reductase PanE/ApbA C terminal-domain-containing protein [Clohesyomyces aquaticus]|uniref:2-dehydropantoate 2-reductase n=1 Tax=Clohesyomyces aquaticus TaxID=1231657 RepID=A0A1Y1ZJ38_9PLEO|nr:ketopantoate reductase PanE/ApbA C terminal-domain-containing protein [Clohesyomyces aquaticus]